MIHLSFLMNSFDARAAAAASGGLRKPMPGGAAEAIAVATAPFSMSSSERWIVQLAISGLPSPALLVASSQAGGVT